MKSENGAYVRDIIKASAAISSYTQGVTRAAFDRNSEKQDAVIRQIEIIGEAANKLTKEFRAKHNVIPWDQVIRMRDRVIHNYRAVDLDIVWEVAKNGSPSLAKYLRGL